MTYNKILKKLKIDLVNTKKADKEDIIFEIINEWRCELIKNHDDFKTAFLSDEADKKFQELKERLGDFITIEEMTVIDFLAKIIIPWDEKDKFFIRLHERFIKEREGARLKY